MYSSIDSFDETAEQLETLQSRLDEQRSDQDRKNDELDSEVSSAFDQCTKLEERIEDLEAECRRLVDELATMRHTAAPSTGPPADFDHFTPSEHTLAASAEHARELKAQLLSKHARTVKSGVITRYESQQDTVAEHEQALLAASRAVAALSYTDDSSDKRAAAAARYRECQRQLATSRAAFGRLSTDQVDEARSQLAADTRLCAKHGATIKAGQRDWELLGAQLRSRLDQALTSGHTLPVWFRTALGSAPPPAGTADWVSTATVLLAYRLTYEVGDQLVALGAPPKDNSRRQSWHDELSEQMQDARRSH